MVSVSSMLTTLSLSLGVASASSLSSLPSYALPTFDYPSLTSGDAPQRLLEALTTDGMVGLKNIPNYAHLRERYLREAAQCAAIKGTDDPFVSRKLFADGTKRMTISTNAGRDLRGSAMETDAACPGFRALYEQFSQTIEHAVNSFGAALDQTAFKASDGHTTISSRQLVSEAVRLDHFHAYEAAAPTTSGAAHRQLEELSLPLHEDHGLFIAMAAPKYFEVEADGRSLVERELAADASGLIIQTPSGQRVRPVLNGEELVLMMGTGASRWLQTSHKLPAVLHGMKMPEPLYGRSLRAWFGKMTLLPAYQRMLETNTPFEAHVNATTRQLLTNDASQLKSVGCASDRRLAPSDEKCTAKKCSTKAGATAPEETCAVVCNRKGHGTTDAAECTAKCTCTDVAGPANVCWMLCVANLSSCPVDSQTCSGQSTVCPASTTTTTTTAPPGTNTPPAPAPADTPAPTTLPPRTNAPPPSSNPVGSPATTPSRENATPAPDIATSSPGATSAPGSTTTAPGTTPGAKPSPSPTGLPPPGSPLASSPSTNSEMSSADVTGSVTTIPATSKPTANGSGSGESTPVEKPASDSVAKPAATTAVPKATPKSSAATVAISIVATVAAVMASIVLI